MNSYSKKKAFTLIELVIGITIIGILAIAVTNMDFSRLTSGQKLDIFSGNIKTNYETIRNKALAGKGIGANLVIPKKWTIDFSTADNGYIISKAYDESNNIIESDSLPIPTDFEVRTIKCGEYNEGSSNYDTMTNTGTIEFEGINIKLNTNSDPSCNPTKDKILEIEVKNRVESKIIEINTINGLIEIKR